MLALALLALLALALLAYALTGPRGQRRDYGSRPPRRWRERPPPRPMRYARALEIHCARSAYARRVGA